MKHVTCFALALTFSLALIPTSSAEISERRARRTGPVQYVPFAECYQLDGGGELLRDPDGDLVLCLAGPSTFFTIDNASAAPSLEVRADIYTESGVYLSAFTRTIADPFAEWTGRRWSFPLSPLLGAPIDLCGDGGLEIPWAVLEPLVGADGIARGFLVLRPVIGCSTVDPDLAVLDCEDVAGAAAACKGISVDVIYTQGDAAQSFHQLAPQWGTHTVAFVGEVGPFSGTRVEIGAGIAEEFLVTIRAFGEDGAPLSFLDSFDPLIYELEFPIGGDRPFLIKNVTDLGLSSPFGDLVITHPEGTLITVTSRRNANGGEDPLGWSIGSTALVTRGEPNVEAFVELFRFGVE